MNLPLRALHLCKDRGNRVTCLHFTAVFAKCAKRNQSPLYGIRRKNEQITLNAHISQMAVANSIKFDVWCTLPGGQL